MLLLIKWGNGLEFLKISYQYYFWQQNILIGPSPKKKNFEKPPQMFLA